MIGKHDEDSRRSRWAVADILRNGFIYPNGTNRKGKWLKEVPVCRVDTENFYVEDVQNSWSACCTQEEPRGFDSFGTVGFKQWWSLTEGE
ncbi:predicted protein [Plenodomus lingam JN3]|uniref:Predicted protein n=1 Tax=Leptosphaeria maculans (strain JN3 / isolate v23.1.3 / race Av1-4-5-6-7-8) TaxID=985895 RepID=E4ZP38_LEPMJ|nr:predicted protein [Plenodomus lingam JN3]CBX93567.1 predicted protein [Plenodomus lingam JN3]